jgi:hypothetical protein
MGISIKIEGLELENQKHKIHKERSMESDLGLDD